LAGLGGQPWIIIFYLAYSYSYKLGPAGEKRLKEKSRTRFSVAPLYLFGWPAS
jgi:hypothetical protein